jgi:hypothetical protein
MSFSRPIQRYGITLMQIQSGRTVHKIHFQLYPDKFELLAAHYIQDCMLKNEKFYTTKLRFVHLPVNNRSAMRNLFHQLITVYDTKNI